MFLALTSILISFVVSAILIVPFIDGLYKLKFFKRKSAIKTTENNIAVHHMQSKVKTPEGAGLLVIAIIAILFPVVYSLVKWISGYVSSNFPLMDEILVVLFAMISFGGLGLYDDIVKFFELDRSDTGVVGLRMGTKLVFQLVFALMIAWFLYLKLGIDFVNLPVLGVVRLGVWFVVFAALTVMVFANAVNFTDGVDGLSMGILLICLFGYLAVSVKLIDTPMSIFIGIWIGGLITFLYFNTYPANIFLGDVGAMAFGAVLAVVALLSGRVAMVFVFGLLFFLEFGTSFIQLFWKKVFRRPILPIAPLHYYFLKKGWSEPQLVQRALVVTTLLVVVGLFLDTL